MEESIDKLRADYRGFLNGKNSNLSVKADALALLARAKSNGDTKKVEEITDMLMDLELSIAENKCNCHKGDSCC